MQKIGNTRNLPGT